MLETVGGDYLLYQEQNGLLERGGRFNLKDMNVKFLNAMPTIQYQLPPDLLKKWPSL